MLAKIRTRISPRLRLKIIEQLARKPLLARLYYCVRGTFEHEYLSVLNGKLNHLRDLETNSDDGAKYTLRRNIHRLEKGLIMRPRRPLFAIDYIDRTVNLYLALTERKPNCEATNVLLSWAGDVLDRYFQAVEPGVSDKVDTVRERFARAGSCGASTENGRAPFRRDLAPLEITIDRLRRLAQRRKSVRWYDPRPVPREILDRAVEVAGYSPSACNRQPFEFRIYDDPKLARELGAIAGGTVGFAENFPCLVVIVGEMRAFPFERDRHLPYIDGALAAMAFQFALEVQGVASCCINWPDVPKRDRAMTKAIGLAPDQRVIMLISVGFPDPDGMVPYSQKKPLAELRSFNRL